MPASRVKRLSAIEMCAGAGGMAIGTEQAGFNHLALIEYDGDACRTLRTNRPDWNTLHMDLHVWSGKEWAGRVDLLAGGVPCPPYSRAGLRRGAGDERDLFPRALDLVQVIRPRAVMLENVPGLMQSRFTEVRAGIQNRLEALGYRVFWRVLRARDFGVPQLRPRVILVGLLEPWAEFFVWPEPSTPARPISVGEALEQLMAERGWEGAEAWARGADHVAPTLAGGSRNHGGAEPSGGSRGRAAFARLGIDGRAIAEEPPGPGFVGAPRLTVRMGAALQGFPPEWVFSGAKGAAWRQVGNALPPPLARAVAQRIAVALSCV